jgi:hypothetical protein
MGVAAADEPAVDHGQHFPRRVCCGRAKRMRLCQRIVGELGLIGRAELVVVEVGDGQPRPLLEHDDGEPRRRQLLGEDAAGGAGPDDDEIDEVAWRVTDASAGLGRVNA